MADTRGEACGIYPILIKGWPVLACLNHDKAYLDGSWHQKHLTRAEVDRAFLLQMLELSKHGRFKPWKRLVSYAFYGVARALGGFWWEGKR